jgi:peptidyl-prolyl cis-trans isomerase C
MHHRLIAMAALAALLAACGKPAPDEVVLAEVAGQPVKAGLFAAYVQGVARVAPEELDPAYRDRLVKQLGRLQAAAAAAEGQLDAQQQRQIELQRLELLARAGAEKAGVLAAPDDAALRAAYEQYAQGLPAAEYRVAHILTATENDARSALRQLDEGKAFASVAREVSLDDSAAAGGELGWIAPGKLPKPFTDAVQRLNDKAHTLEPVKTDYGWHLIRVLERRAATPPPFDAVRAQLAVNLQQQRYEAWLDGFLR